MNGRLGVVALSLFASSAFGGTIYDNGAPPANGNSTWYLAQQPAKPNTNIEFIDDFTLAPGASTIRDIHWWGDAVGADPVDELDSFTLTIYSTAALALAPGAVVTVAQIVSIERTAVDLSPSGDSWLYSARVDDIALTPDTRYWLGISGDSGVNTAWGWRGTLENHGSRGFTRDAGGQLSTSDNFGDAAFYLTDDVPAPGAVALVGVVGVLGAKRRRRS